MSKTSFGKRTPPVPETGHQDRPGKAGQRENTPRAAPDNTRRPAPDDTRDSPWAEPVEFSDMVLSSQVGDGVDSHVLGSCAHLDRALGESIARSLGKRSIKSP